jgi:hypothetical protein
MEHSRPLEADSRSDTQEISRLYETRMFMFL